MMDVKAIQKVENHKVWETKRPKKKKPNLNQIYNHGKCPTKLLCNSKEEENKVVPTHTQTSLYFTSIGWKCIWHHIHKYILLFRFMFLLPHESKKLWRSGNPSKALEGQNWPTTPFYLQEYVIASFQIVPMFLARVWMLCNKCVKTLWRLWLHWNRCCFLLANSCH